jgi:fermentation-respiration switch protein FrsA (DUF1100 family)
MPTAITRAHRRITRPPGPGRPHAASLEPYLTFNALTQAPLVAPTPLLIVHGTIDTTLLPQLARAAYDTAHDPKDLVWINTHNHIELYDQDPYVSEAVGHVRRWLDPTVGAPGASA